MAIAWRDSALGIAKRHGIDDYLDPGPIQLAHEYCAAGKLLFWDRAAAAFEFKGKACEEIHMFAEKKAGAIRQVHAEQISSQPPANPFTIVCPFRSNKMISMCPLPSS